MLGVVGAAVPALWGGLEVAQHGLTDGALLALAAGALALTARSVICDVRRLARTQPAATLVAAAAPVAAAPPAEQTTDLSPEAAGA